MDARTKIILLFCVSVLVLVLERPEPLAVLAILGWAALWVSGLSLRDHARFGVGIGLLAWATVVSQGLFYGDEPRTVWTRLGPVVIWREGMAWGLVQGLRLVAVSAAGLAVAASTPADRLLVGLRGVGVPAALAFLAAAAIRSVGELATSWSEVREARIERGGPPWRRWPWAWLALEVSLLGPVVGRAVRRGRMLARTLDARGYDGARSMVDRPEPLGASGLLVATLAGTATAAAVGARLAYLAYVLDLAYVPAWRPLYAWVRAWM